MDTCNVACITQNVRYFVWNTAVFYKGMLAFVQIRLLGNELASKWENKRNSKAYEISFSCGFFFQFYNCQVYNLC